MSQNKLSMRWDSSKRAEILLILIGVMTWLQTLHGQFVHYDTTWLVAENPILSNPSWAHLSSICCDLSIGVRTELGAEFLPFRDLSVLLDFLIFGDNWFGHHLSNLLYYLVASFFFFQILTHYLGRNWASWIGALLFILHPTHVESVAWLASRKDVLSLMFGFVAMHAILKSKRPILWATIWAAAAYWSKNTAIALPPLLVWMHLLEKKEIDTPWANTISWKAALAWVPMAILFSIGLVITLHVGQLVAMFAPTRGDGFLETASVTFQAFGTYLGLLIVPQNLSIVYPEPVPIGLLSGKLWMGIALVAGSIWASLQWKSSKARSIGGLLIVLGLLPVSQLATIQNLMAERYLLVPTAGFCLILADGLSRLKQHRIAWVCAGMLAVGYTAVTLRRIPVWHDTKTLWRAQTKSQPNAVRGWAALAGRYVVEGELTTASMIYDDALEHLPNHPELLQGLGFLHIQKSRQLQQARKWNEADIEIEKAEDSLIAALSINPDLRKAANNLIQIYKFKKKYDKALILAEDLIEKHPRYERGWDSLTDLCIATNDLNRAQEAAKTSLSIRPSRLKPLKNLAVISYLQGRYNEAESYWLMVLNVDPKDPHSLRGITELKKLKTE